MQALIDRMAEGVVADAVIPLRPDLPIQRYPGDPPDGHDERGGARGRGPQRIARPTELLVLGVQRVE